MAEPPAWTAASKEFTLEPMWVNDRQIAVKQHRESLYVVTYCCKFWRVPVYCREKWGWVCSECRTFFPSQPVFVHNEIEIGNALMFPKDSEHQVRVWISNWFKIDTGHEDITVKFENKDKD